LVLGQYRQDKCVNESEMRTSECFKKGPGEGLIRFRAPRKLGGRN